MFPAKAGNDMPKKYCGQKWSAAVAMGGFPPSKPITTSTPILILRKNVNNNMRLYFITSFLICLLLLGFGTGCKEEADNPFDDLEDPVVSTPEITELNPNAIEGLHANVFGKTCANSGCHDGTFEPDFRTIESTYNTLVFQPVIKNDPQGSFTHRVVPGAADESQLIARLTYDIDGNSGVMPLVIEPDSDWEEKSDDYIQNIRQWINDGARDILGNSPGQSNGLPQMQGVRARSGTWFPRADGGQGALRIPQVVTSVDLYFAFSDDETSPNNFGENKIRFAQGLDDFADADARNLELLSSPISENGYYGNTVNFYHKITFNPHDYAALGEVAYFRVYVQDADNPSTEIPSDGGALYIKNYFSYTIIE